VIDVEIRESEWSWVTQIFVVERDNVDGKVVRICKPIVLEWEDYRPGEKHLVPTMELSSPQGQQLFDKFLEKVRKYEKKPLIPDESGEIKALRYHLEDMRLVFKEKP
jgi:hypothetical protein